MRRLHHSWTNVLTQLGFRRATKRNKRSQIYRRSSRLESLEDRRVLATDDWRTVIDVAPPSFAIGDFTLTSTDWSGKDDGGRVMASGFALGIESKGADKDAGGFQTGEFWSFRFDTPGRLMGIHFEEFSVEDADKALLQIGDRDPIVIDADRVRNGFWRPDRLLEFTEGETVRLVAADPTAVDLQKAEQAYEERISKLDESAANGLPDWQATSAWKVSGLNVIGMSDATYGGLINFAHISPASTAATSAAIVEGYRPPAGGAIKFHGWRIRRNGC